jgi:hypothetical protein
MTNFCYTTHPGNKLLLGKLGQEERAGCMKISTCNEHFTGWSIEKVLQHAAQLGYDGVEVAPFTIADSVTKYRRRSEPKSAVR